MLRYSPVAVAHHIRGESAVYASENNGDNVYDLFFSCAFVDLIYYQVHARRCHRASLDC